MDRKRRVKIVSNDNYLPLSVSGLINPDVPQTLIPIEGYIPSRQQCMIIVVYGDPPNYQSPSPHFNDQSGHWLVLIGLSFNNFQGELTMSDRQMEVCRWREEMGL